MGVMDLESCRGPKTKNNLRKSEVVIRNEGCETTIIFH